MIENNERVWKIAGRDQPPPLDATTGTEGRSAVCISQAACSRSETGDRPLSRAQPATNVSARRRGGRLLPHTSDQRPGCMSSQNSGYIIAGKPRLANNRVRVSTLIMQAMQPFGFLNRLIIQPFAFHVNGFDHIWAGAHLANTLQPENYGGWPNSPP